MGETSTWTFAAILAVFLGGCGEGPAPPAADAGREAAQEGPLENPPGAQSASWQVVAESEMSAAQTRQKDLAIEARDDLMESLKGRLMEVVSTGGPAAAISVCKEDAPRLAAEISQKHGLRIGRTSYRLRNAKNEPPDWARSLVEGKAAEPTFLAGGGQLAALLPIPTGPLCLNCHGTVEGIPEAVQAALAENYPDDQATGFEEGDLRGWFWVEVPAP